MEQSAPKTYLSEDPNHLPDANPSPPIPFHQDRLVVLKLAALHRLQPGTKLLLRLGPFQLLLRTYQSRPEPQAYLAINSYYQPLQTCCKIVKLSYQKSISYMIDDGKQPFLYALTIPADTEAGPMGNLQQYLKMTSLSFDEPDDSMKNKLSIVHQGYLTNPVYNFSKIETKINEGAVAARQSLETIGGYMEKGRNRLSAMFTKSKEQNVVDKEVEELPPQRQSLPEKKEMSTYERFKAKAWRAFEKTSSAVSKVVDPVVMKGKELNAKLCEKIDKSDSKVLHGIKSFATKSNNAIKSAFYTIKDPTVIQQSPQILKQKPDQLPKIPVEQVTQVPMETDPPLQQISGRQDKIVDQGEAYNYQRFDEEKK